jgi:hypothetical protein
VLLHSIKGDMKATMQAKLKQFKLDLGVCKETVDSMTRKVPRLALSMTI